VASLRLFTLTNSGREELGSEPKNRDVEEVVLCTRGIAGSQSPSQNTYMNVTLVMLYSSGCALLPSAQLVENLEGGDITTLSERFLSVFWGLFVRISLLFLRSCDETLPFFAPENAHFCFWKVFYSYISCDTNRFRIKKEAFLRSWRFATLFWGFLFIYFFLFILLMLYSSTRFIRKKKVVENCFNSEISLFWCEFSLQKQFLLLFF